MSAQDLAWLLLGTFALCCAYAMAEEALYDLRARRENRRG